MRVAFWAGAVALLVTLLQLVAIVLLRISLRARQARHARIFATWRPILMQSVYAAPGNLPALPQRDLISFLAIWNHYHESLRGDVKTHLNEIAHRVGADRMVQSALRKAPFQTRLQAVVAAGHLRQTENQDVLRDMLNDESPVLSLAAARVLLQIEPERAVPHILSHITSRLDWPAARVATMLQEAGAVNISKPLAQMAISAATRDAPRLIRFLALASPYEAGPAIRKILHSTDDDHAISTCLQIMNDPMNLDLVRQYASHPRWHVRVQAASALGRLGTRGDETLLEKMLSDEQWWVRYRAAQALAALPFVGWSELETIRERQTDRFAKDILAQIIAEQAERNSA